MLIEATAMPLLPVKPRMGPLVARTAFHDSHSFSGNVMGLMTALRQMLSASDTVSLPGSLQDASQHLMLLSLKRRHQLAAWKTLYSEHAAGHQADAHILVEAMQACMLKAEGHTPAYHRQPLQPS